MLTIKGYPYHEKVMAEHDAAWADGVQVWPQVSCRPLVFQMNLSEPFTLNMRPTFAALMDKPKAERLAAYRDPAWREAAPWADVERAERRVSGQLGIPARSPSPLRIPTWPRGRWPCWPRNGVARRST